MPTFYYDKTFEGLLCTVFDAYTLKLFPGALMGTEESPSLAPKESHTVHTTEEHATRVFRALSKKMTPHGKRRLMHAWLSDVAGADLLLFRYICTIFDNKHNVESDLANSVIFEVHQLAKKVSDEAHRLMGFVRFQKTTHKVYFAAMSPRHDITPLLLHHFKERFCGQRWVLYDIGRRYGVFHEHGRFRDVRLEEEKAFALARSGGRLPPEELDEDESLVQDLWKSYFKAVSIKERANPRQQSRCMSRRYWAYMTEKQ